MFEKILNLIEERRGHSINGQLLKVLSRLDSMGDATLSEFREALFTSHSKFYVEKHRMTTEGQVKMGRELQHNALLRIETDVGRASAHWMLGAWMESAHLPGKSARDVHEFLESFLNDLHVKFGPEILMNLPGRTPEMNERLQAKLDFLDAIFKKTGKENSSKKRATKKRATKKKATKKKSIKKKSIKKKSTKKKASRTRLTKRQSIGSSDFGFTPENPIRAKSIRESYTYISRLKLPTGRPISIHRRGSTFCSGSPLPIDIYTVRDEKGEDIVLLYVSPHHDETSEEVPKGFVFSKEK